MSDTPIDVEATDPVDVEPVIVETPGAQTAIDINAVGRPDPNVRRPARSHRMTQGDDAFTASLFTMPPGWAGDGDAWQIHQDTPDGPALVLTVPVAQIPAAITERQQRADQWRQQAQALLDRAADADRERALVEALAGAEGIKGGGTPPAPPGAPGGRGVRQHAAPDPVTASTDG